MDIQRLESISKILAALLIPLAVAYMGNQMSAANKKQESETKLVEVATGILEKDIPKNQTAEQRELRRWAVTVVNTYSGIPMPKEVENALVETMTLPMQRKTESSTGPWGVVFGADKSVGQALWEIRNADKKAEVAGSQIFLRSGLYRSIAVFTERNEAEDALGKLKQYRSSSYIVDMSKWCPNTVQQADYLECKI